MSLKGIEFELVRENTVFRPQVLWTSLLIAAALVGGVVYNWPSTDTEVPAIEEVVADETSEDERGFPLNDEAPPIEVTLEGQPSAEPIELDALRTGDRLLTGGNFIGAYQAYAKLKRQAATDEDGSLSVRLGLSSELGGFLEQAETHYRTAIESSSSIPLQQLWGLIGTARVWESQGRIDEAVSLLSELLLVYGGEQYPEAVRLPIYKHLTDCLQRKHLADRLGAGTNENIVVQYFWTETAIEPILADDVVWPLRDSPQDDGLSLRVVQKPIKDVSLIVVEITAAFYPVLQMMGELSQALEMDIRISNRARAVLSGRSVRVDSSTLPVSVILDQSLGALSVSWRQVDGVIYVSHNDELAKDERQTFDLARIQRLLRQRQVNFAGSSEQSAVLLQEGNNSLLLDRVDEAANKYKASRGLRPGGELSAMLYYNVGLLESRRGLPGLALRKFYQSLDQTLSPELQAASYAKIAELELELGRPDQAIPAAARGRRLSNDAEVSAQNLMLLAKSYLLESDPFSANQVIFDNAESLTKQENRRLAGVISSYARFQVVKPLRGLQNEGERLVVSLAALRPEDTTSFVDHLLVSRAYRDVGFRSKAVEHLQAAAKLIEGGYWDHRVQLELAQILVEANELEEALDTLRLIVQEGQDQLLTEALLLDAEIRLLLERYEECKQVCESLLELPPDEATQKRTLGILGRIYQQRGQHYAAALCFAGLLPDAPLADADANSDTGAL